MVAPEGLYRADIMSKKFAFYLITFGFMLVVFEVIGYLSYLLEDDIYDNRKEILEAIEKYRLADLRQEGIDPVLGWKYYGPIAVDENNCQGLSIEYAFDRLGARTYSGYDGTAAEVIVSGDSYSYGFEVAAEDSFSAQLSNILGVSVANHAVGGYGPVQAFLYLKQNIDHYPKANIVILGIMYENIFRMVNSYRPVLTMKSGAHTIKPYMHKGVIRPHPGQKVLGNIDSLEEFANDAFDNDFWAKPKHEFPFSVSFLRSLGTDFFYYKKLGRRLRKVGIPEYFLAYRSDDFSLELLSLFDLYAEFARQKNVIPVVVFIPRDKYDRQSVSRFIEKNKDRFPKDLLIGDVGTLDIDWDWYNLMDTREADNINFCHPSPYGQRKIAEYIADLLINSKALER